MDYYYLNKSHGWNLILIWIQNKRREASMNKNKFEEDFYKLMSNSVYGKTMENVRKRQNIKFCNNGKQVSKLIMKPTYKHRTVIDENMILVHNLE